MRTVALGARGAIPGPLLRLVRAGRVFAAACLIAIGVLGVNLMYGAFYHSSDPDTENRTLRVSQEVGIGFDKRF